MRRLALVVLLLLATPAAATQLDRIEAQITRSNDLRAEANHIHRCWLLVITAVWTDFWVPVLDECTIAGRQAAEETD